MSDTITLTGIVGTTPTHMVTTSGLAITSFRLASGQRRFDRTQNAWVDADTNWYSVSTFRHLAHNVKDSVHKGEHVIVSGRIRIRQWETDVRKGTTIEVEAESVGHDLTWCTTSFLRSAPGRSAPASPHDSDALGSSATFPPADTVEWPKVLADDEPDSERDDERNDERDDDEDAEREAVAGDGFLPDEPSSLITVVS
ncbi:single-stranded DNA-binding protein [Leifsonia sp. YAF41]|uniref:single-stranded DNA-binding protein n=1 Tax=Leifsonia sp. YAF41 TaxID=3233086 RepID=UPI003F9CB22D